MPLWEACTDSDEDPEYLERLLFIFSRVGCQTHHLFPNIQHYSGFNSPRPFVEELSHFPCGSVVFDLNSGGESDKMQSSILRLFLALISRYTWTLFFSSVCEAGVPFREILERNWSIIPTPSIRTTQWRKVSFMNFPRFSFWSKFVSQDQWQ